MQFTNQLKIWIIEESSVSEDNSISCYTRRLRSGGNLFSITKYYSYKTEKDFTGMLHNVLCEINKFPELIHILVLSSHGEERTGTILPLKNSTGAINLHLFENYFRILPPNLLIYLSACWGAYPGPLQACTSADTNKPIIIGPMVSIVGKHNQEIQNIIIDTLVTHGLDYASLRINIIHFNKKYQAYYREDCLRIVDKEGQWFPEQGIGGLSALVNSDKKFRIIALQKMSGIFSNVPKFAILWCGESYWQTTIEQLYKVISDSSLNPYSIIGQCISSSYKIINDAGDILPISRIELFGRQKVLKERAIPDRIKLFNYIYAYCIDTECCIKFSKPTELTHSCLPGRSHSK